MLRISLAALILAVASIPATASSVTGQISVGGFAQSNTGSMATATGVTFADASGMNVYGTSGTLNSFGSGTGSFAVLGNCASATTGCGTIKDISNLSSQGLLTSFLTLNTGTATAVSFDLNGISNIVHPAGGFLEFTASGIINFTGYDSTPGTFYFSAQGNNIVSFSGTLLANPVAATTPEPSSLVLLAGPSLLLAFRRVRQGIVSSMA